MHVEAGGHQIAPDVVRWACCGNPSADKVHGAGGRIRRVRALLRAGPLGGMP